MKLRKLFALRANARRALKRDIRTAGYQNDRLHREKDELEAELKDLKFRYSQVVRVYTERDMMKPDWWAVTIKVNRRILDLHVDPIHLIRDIATDMVNTLLRK